MTNPYDAYDWSGCTFSTAYLRSIYEWAAARQFKRILEIGFDSGSSALAFLRACPDANVFSVDIDGERTQVGRDLIARSGEGHRHAFVHADSREYLKSLAQAGETFDCIYVDGDHLYDVAKADLENALPLLAPGGAILADDADPSHAHFGSGRAVDEVAQEHNLIKVGLPGSPSAAVILLYAE